MSETKKPEVGTIAWHDLTVENATEIGKFYAEVVGWKAEPVDMGGYSDLNMSGPDSGDPRAGVCHARGSNAGLPAQWLLYIVVEDLDRSAKRTADLGGEILVPPKETGGHGRYCVIRDPAGAVSALFEPAT
jgi:predicted enzyme related to lactoylglutathione lyase